MTLKIPKPKDYKGGITSLRLPKEVKRSMRDMRTIAALKHRCWCGAKAKYNQGNDCPAHKLGRFKTA